MLLTMTCLYNWADWDTGVVKHVSAGGLHTWTLKAYSERTFSEALRKLEWMGWITRHMKAGSHKSYAVTINNYKVMDDAGKVQVINPKDITIWEEYPKGRCGEGSDESSDESSDETSDRTNLKPNLKPNLKNDSQDESLLASKSDSLKTTTPSASSSRLPEEQEKPKSDRGAEAKQDYLKDLGLEIEEEDKVYAENVLNDENLAQLLGVRYWAEDHVPLCQQMARLLRHHGRSAHWLYNMAKWMKEHAFWKKRLHAGERAIGQLLKFLANGDVVAQYDQHIVLTQGDNALRWDGEHTNAYLYWTHEQMCALVAKYPRPASGSLHSFADDRDASIVREQLAADREQGVGDPDDVDFDSEEGDPDDVEFEEAVAE